MSRVLDSRLLPIPAGGRVRGSLRVPGSKSLTNRYLVLALLADAPTEIERPLVAEDTERLLAALAALGCGVEARADRVRVVPRERAVARASLDCGASGTMARFLTAALTVLPGEWRLDGVERLRQRPLAPLLAALESLGARIDATAGCLPLTVHGAGLAAGRARVAAGESSQYVSGLLLAATRALGEVVVEVDGLRSAPYVELTIAAMAEFGCPVERRGASVFAVRPRPPHSARVVVPGDDSAACYPAAAALVTGGAIELEGLARDSEQADRGFFEWLRRMGGGVEWRGDRLTVRSTGALTAVDADLSSMPDQVPTLAALAPFARGTTRISNVPHLRHKESDRLAAVAGGLRRLGVEVVEHADGLEIPGCWSRGAPPEDSVEIDTCGDHRIAMSFAVLGLRRPGVVLREPGVVAKSYPGFWRDLWEVLGE